MLNHDNAVLRSVKSLLGCLACLYFLCISTATAQVNTLQDPSLLNFNLAPATSATFHLPNLNPENRPRRSNSYYVSLSVCNVPAGTENSTTLSSLLSVFDAEDTTDPVKASTADAEYGFANLTITRPQRSDNGIWIVVNAPASNSRSARWSFQLGASTSEFMHVTDSYPLFQYGDSDNTTAIFTSPTYFPTLDGTPEYEIFVMPTSAAGTALQLSHSFCHISQANGLLAEDSINASNTTRGVVVPGIMDGALGRQREEAEAGGQRTQWVLSGLEAGTNYTVWGAQRTTQATADQVQGVRMYSVQYFVTKTGVHEPLGILLKAHNRAGNNCRLVTDYPSCPNLAYSVPSPPELPTSLLLESYDATLQRHLQGFNQTLSIFPCGIPSQGLYSPVRTCEDCLSAYQTWLCSIVLPRCTDIPPNETAQLNATVPLRIGYNDQPIPSEISTTLIRSNPLLSRTPQFGPQQLQSVEAFSAYNPTTPFPYAEVPTCSAVCHLVYASCPPMIDWHCPVEAVSLTAGYGEMREISADETQGGNEYYREDVKRSADRFGNVFCNGLNVDVLVGARTL